MADFSRLAVANGVPAAGPALRSEAIDRTPLQFVFEVALAAVNTRPLVYAFAEDGILVRGSLSSDSGRLEGGLEHVGCESPARACRGGSAPSTAP